MPARALRAAVLLFAAAVAGRASTPLVIVGRIDTPIHPAAANYLAGVLARAEKEGADLVVLTLSTPGGLLASTREMSSAILQSKVPVATFVAPSGAQAASAGFFLLISGDVAAMAPGTNTGAAHPVGGEGQDLPKKMNEKAEQDARAFVRTLAKQRGRNVQKAEAAVQDSISYTEAEAKDGGLIELIARDVPDLVSQLDGRKLVARGRQGNDPRAARLPDPGAAHGPARARPRRRLAPQRRLRPVPDRAGGAVFRALDSGRDPAGRGGRHRAAPGLLRVFDPSR